MTNLDMNEPAPEASRLPRDLVQRVASGLVLASTALVLDYAGTLPFAFLVIFVSMVMSWEWGRMVRAQDLDAAHVVHAVAVALAAILAALGAAAIGVLVIVAGAIAVVPLRFGERAPLSALGVFYVGIPAVSMLWIRSDWGHGFAAILLIFIVVWATDTFAYVAGRSIGGAKLWPSISPNKTWSGLIGGVGAAAAVAMVFSQFVPGASAVLLGITGLLLGLVSQAGDLLESALKRSFGVKDSSTLIPGHGGVMDRLDGLIAAATLAALIALAVNPRFPARAILLGF